MVAARQVPSDCLSSGHEHHTVIRLLLVGVLATTYYGCTRKDVRLAATEPLIPTNVPFSDYRSFWEAILEGDAGTVRKLVNTYPDLIGARLTGAEGEGNTPLHGAVGYGHQEVVEALLEAGMHPDTTNDFGLTGLHVAAKCGYPHIAEVLLTNGATVNARIHTGWTPLHAVVAHGHLNVARVLLSHGANPVAKDIAGITPIAMAKVVGKAEFVTLMRASLPEQQDD